jgi:Na+/proline symporter
LKVLERLTGYDVLADLSDFFLAFAGMSAGFLVWAYTLLLPTLSDIGVVGERILTAGPWGLSMLRPQHLLGLELPPLVHGVTWSLLLNMLFYIGFSLRREPSPIERLQAFNVFRRQHACENRDERHRSGPFQEIEHERIPPRLYRLRIFLRPIVEAVAGLDP